MPDRHATSWKNPCWICGRVNSHDHTTAEWTAAEWAVAAERARIRAAVEGPLSVHDHTFDVAGKAPFELIRMGAEAAAEDIRSAVLAIIDGADDA